MSHNIVWQTFLSLDAVKLGRLVVNPEEPHQDFLDPINDLTPNILSTPQLHYVDVQNDTKHKSIKTDLTSLASASHSRGKIRLAAVTTDRSTFIQLANSGLWFKASLQNEETRNWIEEVNKTGDDIYVVVGYQTMIDAKALGDDAMSSSLQAQLQLPVSEAAAASGSVTTASGIADPRFGINQQTEHGLRRQLVAEGEQVYAVQYRKVRFKWYSSRDLDRATLEKGSRWVVQGVVRGQEVGTNDVLDASISSGEESEAEEILSADLI